MSRSITLHEGLRHVAAGHHLDRLEAQHLFERVLDGEADAAVLGGFLAALAQRGERPEEVAGVAAALRARMTPFVHGAVDAVDTCGTGGDGLGMINVSTAAAFVAAAAGARVVKHGNRSVSSRSGSADVLEALGGEVDVDADVALEALERTGFTFLFAPRYHPAMRHAAPVRRALGIRTVFNLVGPLANPGGVRRQVVGAPTPHLQDLVAGALRELGAEAALVVHGHGGADELTLSGPNRVASLGLLPKGGFDAVELGLTPAPVSDLEGGGPKLNAEVIHGVLSGAPGAARDVVALNAAATLVVAGVAADPSEGVERSFEALDSGRALAVCDGWVRITRRAA